MRIRYIAVIVFTMVFLSACGSGNSPALPVVPADPGDDVTPPVGMVTSLSITPRSTLLARLDDTHQLNAELLDEDGAMVDKPVAWTSSDPNIVAVDEQGLLTSMGTIGSASVTAEVDGVTSGPVIVVVVLPALNTQFVNDDQVVGDMELVDPESQYAPGAQYRVTLTGIDVPDIGTILLARETQLIAGGVVDVQQDGDEIIVTLEVLPIDELVTSMKIDQVFVPTEDDITMSQEASEYYTMERLEDGSYLFTLLPDTPVAEPVGSSVQSARTADSMVQAIRPPDSTVQAVIGTVANPFYPFDCKFTGPSFTGNSGNEVFTLQGLSPTIGLEKDISLPFVYDSALGGLQEIKLQARVKGTFTFRNKLSVQLEGKAGCKLKLLEIPVPFPAPLGLVLGGQIPLGIGFELSGKVTLADMGFGVTANSELRMELGMVCPNGENCAFDEDGAVLTATGEAKPVIDLPPGLSNPAGDLKFEPAVEGFGYADFTFGHPLFSSWRMTLANLQAGVKVGANLALVETQIDDGSYASDYKLSTEFSAKPGEDLADLLTLLGTSQLNALTLTDSTILLTSPAAEVPLTAPTTKLITADVANYTVGDVVTFTVKLDPSTVNFIPFVYNVDEVMIYRDNELVAGANDPTRVERRTASDGQTEFTITWTATESGSIGDNFHAFVSTDLLPLPYFGELELGKVRGSSADKAWGSAELIETDNAGNAYRPQIAIDNNGNAIAVWLQHDGTRWNIRANRFDGTSWGSAELIETNNAGDAFDPQIAVDGNGNALAVWAQSDGTRNNIWANRFDGTSWGSAVLIETNNAGNAFAPQIAADNNGNALAVWQQSDGTRFNIWAKRFDGTSWGSATLISTNNAIGGFVPRIAFDNNGNALAVWRQFGGTPIISSIWANRFDGTSWGSAELIENNNAGDGWEPQIAFDNNGNALAVWQQFDGPQGDPSSRDGIWANRFDGTSWGSAEQIDTNNARGTFGQQIAFDNNGNALAVWQQGDGIWANRFDGTSWGIAELIETNNAVNASRPQIAVDSNGNALAVWHQSDGIGANRFDGTSWGSAELIATSIVSGADSPQIAFDNNGNALAVWGQSDGTRLNIWANRFE